LGWAPWRWRQLTEKLHSVTVRGIVPEIVHSRQLHTRRNWRPLGTEWVGNSTHEFDHTSQRAAALYVGMSRRNGSRYNHTWEYWKLRLIICWEGPRDRCGLVQWPTRLTELGQFLRILLKNYLKLRQVNVRSGEQLHSTFEATHTTHTGLLADLRLFSGTSPDLGR